MPNKMQRIILAAGVGALLMGSSLAARADDDGGVWFGVHMGPVHAWVAPPPVVVVRPPVRVYDYPYRYHDRREDRREARRAWRRHEWREHHRRIWRGDDDHRDYGYGYGRPGDRYRD